jgi:hypothetical protein
LYAFDFLTRGRLANRISLTFINFFRFIFWGGCKTSCPVHVSC